MGRKIFGTKFLKKKDLELLALLLKLMDYNNNQNLKMMISKLK